MLLIISPAKNLDFDTPATLKTASQPEFLDQASTLISLLRDLAPQDIAALMGLSDKLAQLNYDRYQAWQRPFTQVNAKQAVLAFNGDVYVGLDAPGLKAADLKFAQKHLRILSGLYGLLRPLDLIQAYRLEMGTKFKNPEGKDLYQFWGEQITEALNRHLAKQKASVLVNLASNEYFKAVKPKLLNAEVITPEFKDLKNGQYKMISFYAKKARGMMCNYAIRHRLTEANDLKSFDMEGYKYNKRLSSASKWVYTRDNPDSA